MLRNSLSNPQMFTSVCKTKPLVLLVWEERHLKNLCMYVFLAVLGLPCLESFSLAVAYRLLVAVASLAVEHRLSGSRASGLAGRGVSSCGSWAPELRLHSCGARDFIAPWREQSSRTRDRTRVSCTSRWTLPRSHQGSPERLFFFWRSHSNTQISFQFGADTSCGICSVYVCIAPL